MYHNDISYNICKVYAILNINITGGTGKEAETATTCKDITKLNNKQDVL